jgi:two-component system OmpR family response regulator
VDPPNPLILVVEAIPDLRGVFCTALEGAGFTTRSAASARETLAELAAGLRPSLFLLDVRLPDMDGLTVLAQLRRDSGLAAIPVVLVSGDTEVRMVQGAARVFVLPFAMEELVDAVRAILASSSGRRVPSEEAGASGGRLRG